MIYNGIVYVGSWDSNIYALNAITGEKIWSYKTSGPVQSTPLIRNGVVYIGSSDQNVYALNATNGVKIWNYTTLGSVNSAPTFYENTVYIGSNDHCIYALKINQEPIINPTVPSILVIMAISCFSLACILVIKLLQTKTFNHTINSQK